MVRGDGKCVRREPERPEPVRGGINLPRTPWGGFSFLAIPSSPFLSLYLELGVEPETRDESKGSIHGSPPYRAEPYRTRWGNNSRRFWLYSSMFQEAITHPNYYTLKKTNEEANDCANRTMRSIRVNHAILVWLLSTKVIIAVQAGCVDAV